jgi:hypothetical protein
MKSVEFGNCGITTAIKTDSIKSECKHTGSHKTKTFISKAKKMHGNRYDYSKSSYTSAHQKLIIICPIHGEFKQIANNHLSGAGCLVCKHRHVSRILSHSTNDFVALANKKHDYLYCYKKVEYVNGRTPIKIHCPNHGVFFMRPDNHLSGQGCPKCGDYRQATLKKLTDYKFTEKANRVHNSKYDYSRIKYNGSHRKIKIFCRRHGYFVQTPTHHLSGEGCPRCSRMISNKETKFLDYLNVPISNRQKSICGKKVDGLDSTGKIIYEFLGDYWHGNPSKYLPDKINGRVHKTFGELYDETFIRFNILKNAGHRIKYVWESEWDLFVADRLPKPKINEYNKLSRIKICDKLVST